MNVPGRPAVARKTLNICLCSPYHYEESLPDKTTDNNRSSSGTAPKKRKVTQEESLPDKAKDTPETEPMIRHNIVNQIAWDKSEELQTQITELEKSKIELNVSTCTR